MLSNGVFIQKENFLQLVCQISIALGSQQTLIFYFIFIFIFIFILIFLKKFFREVDYGKKTFSFNFLKAPKDTPLFPIINAIFHALDFSTNLVYDFPGKLPELDDKYYLFIYFIYLFIHFLFPFYIEKELNPKLSQMQTQKN